MLTIKKKSLKVGKFVNTDHVNTVIKNYKQERWVNNSKHIGKEDSLSAWLSIEEMEEFIAKAKDYAADGIRIYFAAYPTDYPEQPLYEGRQSLVFVGTKRKENESGIAADKDIYITNKQGSSILAYNSLSICPPFCKPKGTDNDGIDIGISIVDKGEDGLVVV
jgi:hypothetical protein